MKISLAVSVLIPVYNVENYIERCLLSVLNNTIIDKCEIILVNDASTDSSVIKIQGIMDKYPEQRIYLYSNPENKGIGSTRQEALNHAKGKYIICVDSDDWVEPDYIELLYNKAEETGADLVLCSFIEEKRKGKIIFKPYPSNNIEALKLQLLGKASDPVWIKLFKRSIFTENNLSWDPNYNWLEDTLITIKFLCYAKKIENIEKPLYHYNLTNINSISRIRNVEYHVYALTVYDAAEVFLKKNNLYSMLEKEITYAKISHKITIINKSNFLSSLKNFYTYFTEEEIQIIRENKYSGNISRLYLNLIYKKFYFSAFLVYILRKLKRVYVKIKN